ncbi:hypothetical protein BV20DRAFT_52902 [Pilatotrama ljubarskyi]|nr:hypothetical protein BV20DRAFT_52902 [Pilatotrama ljubarskyi]
MQAGHCSLSDATVMRHASWCMRSLNLDSPDIQIPPRVPSRLSLRPPETPLVPGAFGTSSSPSCLSLARARLPAPLRASGMVNLLPASQAYTVKRAFCVARRWRRSTGRSDACAEEESPKRAVTSKCARQRGGWWRIPGRWRRPSRGPRGEYSSSRPCRGETTRKPTCAKLVSAAYLRRHIFWAVFLHLSRDKSCYAAVGLCVGG